MRHDLIAATAGALLLLAGCSASDPRCTTTGNPRECAQVVAAGGRFEDYRRYGLGGYQLSGGHLYRPASMTVGHIGSYDMAISRFEAREIRRRSERLSRQTRNNVRRHREAARRRNSH